MDQSLLQTTSSAENKRVRCELPTDTSVERVGYFCNPNPARYFVCIIRSDPNSVDLCNPVYGEQISCTEEVLPGLESTTWHDIHTDHCDKIIFYRAKLHFALNERATSTNFANTHLAIRAIFSCFKVNVPPMVFTPNFFTGQ